MRRVAIVIVAIVVVGLPAWQMYSPGVPGWLVGVPAPRAPRPSDLPAVDGHDVTLIEWFLGGGSIPGAKLELYADGRSRAVIEWPVNNPYLALARPLPGWTYIAGGQFIREAPFSPDETRARFQDLLAQQVHLLYSDPEPLEDGMIFSMVVHYRKSVSTCCLSQTRPPRGADQRRRYAAAVKQLSFDTKAYRIDRTLATAEHLGELARGPDYALAYSAVLLLGHEGTPETRAVLEQLSNDPRSAVGRMARRQLGQFVAGRF